ncbi:hypothetical protein PRUPE_3G211300 [Prunus persica]|uniref:Uncharacterized protein n=1 Tax=Prunus persica TaxID=3760 RepID=A0A251Q3N5_PRUPE|nr:hypothetical protein PRUPE_3G211300 [Prunus persica]
MSGSNGSPIWDRLVFNKIKEKLGGRVHFMGSGASPLSPDVMDFLRVGPLRSLLVKLWTIEGGFCKGYRISCWPFLGFF